MNMVYVVFLIGVCIGSIVTRIILDIRATSGVLKIDHSNPEKDIYRIEFESIDKLSKIKRVILKVDNHADLSHE